MIERGCLVTVNQTISKGKNKGEEVFQYRVHAMFGKFSNKWWLSLNKIKIWIKSQAPYKDNNGEMVKLKLKGRKENNKTTDNSKPTATKKKLYRLLVKTVEERNGLYKEV